MPSLKLQYLSAQQVKVTPPSLFDRIQSLRTDKQFQANWNGNGLYYTVTPHCAKNLVRFVQYLNIALPKEQISLDDTPEIIKNLFLHKATKKDDKLLVFDPLLSERYSFLKKVLQKLQIGKPNNKYKALIFCPAIHMQSWMSRFSDLECREYFSHIIFRPLQVLPYQKSFNLIGSLKKFNPDYVFCDCGEFLLEFDTLSFHVVSQFLKERLILHICVETINLRWKQMHELLSTLRPVLFSDEAWFCRRYNSKNSRQLRFLLENSVLQNLDPEPLKVRCTINKVHLSMPKAYHEKVKSVCPGKELDGQTLSSKLQGILSHISFMNMKRCLIVTSFKEVERRINAYLLESQFKFCSYRQIKEFNSDLSYQFCIANVSQMSSKSQNSSTFTFNGQSEGPPQQSALDQVSSVSICRHVIFVDCPWVFTDREEDIVSLLLSDMKRSYTKHIFVAADSYEVQLSNSYSELHKSKEDRIFNLYQQSQKTISQTVLEINSKVRSKYSGAPQIQQLYDIDEEFDKLEFQILQQKVNREDIEKPLYKIQQEELMKEQINSKKVKDSKNYLIPDSPSTTACNTVRDPLSQLPDLNDDYQFFHSGRAKEDSQIEKMVLQQFIKFKKNPNACIRSRPFEVLKECKNLRTKPMTDSQTETFAKDSNFTTNNKKPRKLKKMNSLRTSVVDSSRSSKQMKKEFKIMVLLIPGDSSMEFD